jgi:3-oxoacyl-[acyl-carrier protein] reductase
MCRTFYAAMKKQGHGVIINVTGLAGERLDANYIAGSSGNAGLNAFTRALGSKSLIGGIRVLAVSPGACETERLVGLMRTKAEDEYGDPEHWQSYLGGLPLGRAATVCEVAEVVTFMSSERASYMSGVIILVDGGYGANN